MRRTAFPPEARLPELAKIQLNLGPPQITRLVKISRRAWPAAALRCSGSLRRVDDAWGCFVFCTPLFWGSRGPEKFWVETGSLETVPSANSKTLLLLDYFIMGGGLRVARFRPFSGGWLAAGVWREPRRARKASKTGSSLCEALLYSPNLAAVVGSVGNH